MGICVEVDICVSWCKWEGQRRTLGPGLPLLSCLKQVIFVVLCWVPGQATALSFTWASVSPIQVLTLVW